MKSFVLAGVISARGDFSPDESLLLLQTKARMVQQLNASLELESGAGLSDPNFHPKMWPPPAAREGRMCSMAGDVHKELCHVSGGNCQGKDPMQLGLLKLTESKDGRFKSQMHQCQAMYGVDLSWMNMVGMMIDGTKIVIRTPTNDEQAGQSKCGQIIQVKINDDEYSLTDTSCSCDTCRDIPTSVPGTDILIERSGTNKIFIKHPEIWQMITFTATAGYGGQYWFNYLNYMMEYKDIANVQAGTNLVCNRPDAAQPLNANGDWSGSIFNQDDHEQLCAICDGQNDRMSVAGQMGATAHSRGWANQKGEQCEKPPALPPSPPAKDRCEEKDCNWDHAQMLCSSLKGKEDLYHSCLDDYCATCDDTTVAAILEEANEASENPVCSVDSPKCNPDEACEQSVRMNALSVKQNNLGGVGPDSGAEELRFGNAAVIDGRTVDLVVTADGDYPVHKASKVGTTGKFGIISLKCKKTVTLDFQAIDVETGEAVNLDMVTISWYDLDEGKKGKGRSSVTTCGATGAIVSSNTELVLTDNGGCKTATSSTRGTGKDNPTDPFLLDPVQRARSVSFPLTNVKTFTSSLTIGKGHGGRNFMFAIEPSVACPANFGFAEKEEE